MSFSIEKHTGVLIKKAARLFEQVANKDLKELGVTYAQTIILIRLLDRDGQSQGELAKSAGLKQPTVVRLLERMERDKLVKRISNKNDGRVFNFFLTPTAKIACKKLELHANKTNEIATKSIPKKDVEKLNQLIADVIINLQEFLENKADDEENDSDSFI